MRRLLGSSSSSDLDESSNDEELLHRKGAHIPKRSDLPRVIRRPLGSSSSSSSDHTDLDIDDVSFFGRSGIPKIFAKPVEKQKSAALGFKAEENEQPVTNARPGKIVSAKPGKGSGMTGNCHVSEQNRIVSGTRFEELTDVTQIHIQGGDGSTEVLRTFQEAELPSELLENLLRMGIIKPTAVQCATLPLIIRKSDFDIIAQDQTGSGKTAAYLLPIIKHIHDFRNQMRLSQRATARQPFAIVVLPTRELAGQIAAEAANLVQNLNVTVAASYGQMDMEITRQQLRVGCDILIGTPGRIIGHIKPDRPMSVHLNSLRWTVIDEADHFLHQDRKIFETVMGTLSQHHERLYVFSATFDQYVVNTYKRYMKSTPFEIFGRQGMPDVVLEWRLIEDGGTEQKLETLVTDLTKIGLHQEVFPKTVIFANQKRRCGFVAFHLALHDIKVIYVCGGDDMTQEQREKMMERFASGEYRILVCTDVAARGLNMKDVQYVINFDFPATNIDSFIHRIGRTGRAGNKGHSITMFEQGRDNASAHEIIKMMDSMGKRAPSFIYRYAGIAEPGPESIRPVDDEASSSPDLIHMEEYGSRYRVSAGDSDREDNGEEYCTSPFSDSGSDC
ncbi:hypothetical protein QR680_005240 [Steinernema hermaphroditum]|uniref:ATP-dependent RNA helicase n=1 Tax=Steinernema hermaphroditum TaxID=289476 RepID=A0AA39HSC8_9BILA|nr:hypothetical protein QR680_005240 [Steinernema hermaphroditum]